MHQSSLIAAVVDAELNIKSVPVIDAHHNRHEGTADLCIDERKQRTICGIERLLHHLLTAEHAVIEQLWAKRVVECEC